MEELGSECTSHPLLLTVYRLTSVPNTGGSAIGGEVFIVVTGSGSTFTPAAAVDGRQQIASDMHS
eukprot:SAG11_NODE_4954_length_1711_cov_1.644541_1_plen_65_part_00